MSSTSATIITQEWVDSLVGRDWEIFWKQTATAGDNDNNNIHHDSPTAVSAVAPTVNSPISAAVAAAAAAVAMDIDGMNNVKNDSHDDDASNNQNGDADADDDDDSSSASSYAEDWYHGRVQGVKTFDAANADTNHRQAAVFHVRFEGEDAIYDMALYPENVRPCAKSWIRRTRRILMDTTTTTTTTTSLESNTATTQTISANVGDGKFWWERQLPPDTRMLSDEPYLQQIQQTIEAEFRHTAAASTPIAAAASTQPLQDSSGSNDEEFESILRLTVLLEQQIYLRSKLAPITFEEQPSPSQQSMELSAEHEPTKSTTIIDAAPPPSEAYCGYLVQCLKELTECCRWYCRVHPIVVAAAAAAAVASTTTTTRPPPLLEKMSRDDFFQSCIEGGRATMARLISLVDSSLAGMKRKRKRGPILIFTNKTLSSSTSPCTNGSAAAAAVVVSSSTVPSSSSSSVATTSLAAAEPISVTSSAAAAVPVRRTKRQRRMYKTDGSGTDCYWQKSHSASASGGGGDQDATTMFLQDLHVEDFLSTAMVKRLVKSMVSHDKRWYSISIGSLLLKLSSNIIGPFVKWERKAEYYLGDRDTLQLESSSDGETSGEDSDDDDDDEEKEEDGDDKPIKRRDSQRMVKYEEIESLADLAQRDAVLSRFELGAFVKRLEEKLAAVDVFQEECWNAISTVLDEDGTNHAADCNAQANDETMKNLRGLLTTANSKESAVGNVEPFGKESVLTRCVLENAIIYQTWFLDVLYAETVRERVALVDGVVSRLSKLPSLPSMAASTRASGTSANVVDISMKLDAITPRVQTLSAKCVDNVALISQYMTLLSKPPSSNGEEQEAFDMDAALGELKNVPVISIVEEKIAVRRDMQSWSKKARQVLTKSRPAFEDLAKLKVELQSIFQGQSPTRKDIVKNLRPNAEVEAEIQAFAKSDDVLAFCWSNNEQTAVGLHQRCLTLCSAAELWKDRCDAILTTLRAYGNADAGSIVGMSTPKTMNMIDLKRIDDLLREYQSLEVDLNADHQFLRKVNEHAVAWSSGITSQLLDDNASFTQMLHFVEAGNRPRGIIINPTRQVMDMLAEFLRWHAAVKAFVNTMDDQDDNVSARLYPILVTGLEVVELYNNSRPCASHKFVFETKETMRLLSERLDSRKPCRLSRSKLEASTIALSVLSRVVDQARDRDEGAPLMSLVYCIWQIHAEDFAKRNSSADAPRSQFTVDVASELNKSKPVVEGSPVLDMIGKKNRSHWISEFESLVAEGEAMEHSVTRALADSKGLLRMCLRRSQDVNAHLVTLRDLQTTTRATHAGSRPSLSISKTLEQQLEHNVKLFGWVVRALQFPVLLHESTDSDDEASGDDRISYEVLVKLFDSRPTPEQEDMKDFACLLLRVCELHKAARAWQEEVSNLTMISLRGGKRRASPMKGEGPDNDEPSRIDVGKVYKFSTHKILKKVAMPREEAIRAMSQGTEKFEIMLNDLFAKDYDGICPDRAPYPTGRSLVDDDGALVIRRLTFSPLFVKIKESIIDIQAVANDVFAETPGKTAFDWIARSVSWIDSLSAALVHEKNAEGRLVLPTLTAGRLLEEGENVLLDIPDDLRKTLSSHGVFVSTNKDGKLTVKSKKDGSHHSLGTTVILWSPILLEALREDILKSRKWEQSVTSISKEVIEFHKPGNGRLVPKDESVVLQVHRFLKEISILSDECSDLVVAPSKSLIDAIGALKSRLEEYIRANSNPDISRKALEGAFCAASAIVRDRFLLLDALVGRCAVASGPIEPPDDKVSKDLPFRSACRGFIEKALQKAAAIMDLSQDSRETGAFSRFKAWEIEEALFQEFQGALGTTRMSKQYLEQAKALKRGLEDPENTTLCLRILAEDISAKSLTRITSDQLANPKVRRARAQAEADAREAAILTRDMSPAPVAKPKEPLKKPPAIRTQSQPIISKETKNAKKPSPESGAKKPGTTLGDIVKTVRTSLPPPPPPPSLAALPLERTGAPSRSSRGRQISSSSGKDRFYLSLAEGKRKFSAGFYLEDDTPSPAENLLPDQLAQTGRLPIAEFCKFVAGKMESGNWDTILLRLVPASEADAREYKKFYKEYEAKQRIAMLSLDNSAKLFLLTPKFHKDAKIFLALKNATSTYGVLLMRR